MAVFECPSCHQQRSRGKNMPCNVCWLIADLLEEHAEGQHVGRPAHGCGKCAPVLRSQIAPKALAVVRSSDATMRAAESRMRELSVLTPAGQRSARTPVAKAAVPRVAGSHANCEHESTRAARAKCRAQRRKAAS